MEIVRLNLKLKILDENCVVDTCEDGENLYIGGDKVYFFERGVNNYRQVGVSKILGKKSIP